MNLKSPNSINISQISPLRSFDNVVVTAGTILPIGVGWTESNSMSTGLS